MGRASLAAVPRRVSGRRLDHVLILVGGAIASLGSLLPWLDGSTRLNGTLHWTGIDDTGEGLMLIAASLALAGWVRWRGALERELTPQVRFLPIVVAVGGALLWVIATRKMLYLSWWEIEVGARPQPGLWIAGLGLAVLIAGGILAATDPGSVAAARAAREQERRRSGAGGDGAASDRFRRGGGGRPPGPGGYSVLSRVDRTSGPAGGEGDGGPARG